MDNVEIARVLDEVADLLEIIGQNPFRIRAYRTASRTVGALAEQATKIVARDPAALSELPGIGKDLAGKIAELATTGDLAIHRELLLEVPASLAVMMRVGGVGAKRAKLFYEELALRSLDDLECAARDGKLRELRGIGEALEKRILQGCAEERSRGGRIPLSKADAHARPLADYLRASPCVEELAIAGSLRRRKSTIGDVDLLVASNDPLTVADRFVGYPDFTKVLAHGETKCSAVLSSGLQVDLRVVEPACWGAALHYFTGSKAHNIAVRTLGVKRKLKISEYGVFRGERRIAGRTEEEIFEAVGLPFIPPELREDSGEVQAAREGKLPRLVDLGDIRGDLHVHTSAGEGADTLRAMVEACSARGYEYVAITQRARSMRGPGGLDRGAIRRQRREIDVLRRELPRLTILNGVEVDVRDDGGLGLDDEMLADLDFILAGVPARAKETTEKLTRRVLAAIANPHVNALIHPAGRRVGERESPVLELAQVVASARDHGVLLEIDAQPDRLELADTLIRMARDARAKHVICSDAHRVAELDLMRYGVDLARRGWCTADDIANTLPTADLLATLRRGRARTRRPRGHAAYART
jgi:DNA polymerase (family 10)